MHHQYHLLFKPKVINLLAQKMIANNSKSPNNSQSPPTMHNQTNKSAGTPKNF